MLSISSPMTNPKFEVRRPKPEYKSFLGGCIGVPLLRVSWQMRIPAFDGPVVQSALTMAPPGLDRGRGAVNDVSTRTGRQLSSVVEQPFCNPCEYLTVYQAFEGYKVTKFLTGGVPDGRR